MANTVITEELANGQLFANGYYGTGLANAFSFRSQAYVADQGSANNRFVDVHNIILAGYASAPATLFFYNYNSPDRIEIYQGSTLIAETANATNLTGDDRAFVVSANAGFFFDDNPDLYLQNFALSTINGQSYATYSGKITWTHNPSLGSTYTIRTSKGNGSFDWRYIVQYPIDGFTVGCPAIAPPQPPPPPPPIMQVAGLSGAGARSGGYGGII